MTASDPAKWKLHHTALRVKQPQRSIEFYKSLGMSLINHVSLPDIKLDLYFLGFNGLAAHWGDQEGVLELLHNHGSEDDLNFEVASGNDEEGKGFGHIAISVDNLEAICQQLQDAGHKFQKKPTDGGNPNIAFVLDPDGYWVELIRQKPAEETKGFSTTDMETYHLNHTMLRVKNADASMKFYLEVLGMKHLGTLDLKQAGYSLHFLAYAEADAKEGDSVVSDAGVLKLAGREGILELRWDYGTENVDGRVFHSGNEDPLGFGHVALAVDDLVGACELMTERKVTWVKKLAGPEDQFAFFLDPDGYWIEMIQNQRFSK